MTDSDRFLREAIEDATDRYQTLERDLGADFDPLRLDEDDAAHVAVLRLADQVHAIRSAHAKEVALLIEQNRHQLETLRQAAHRARMLSMEQWWRLPLLPLRLWRLARWIDHRIGASPYQERLTKVAMQILRGEARP